MRGHAMCAENELLEGNNEKMAPVYEIVEKKSIRGRYRSVQHLSLSRSACLLFTATSVF